MVYFRTMKAVVCVIEDIQDMSDLIALYLGQEGLEVLCFQTAEAALTHLENGAADLVVLDLNLPGMDGFEFLQRFRKESEAPVIVISARDADEDVILGLGLGADDYVGKPFSPRVLAARVRSHLRRASLPKQPESDDFEFGLFDYNSKSKELRYEGRSIHITAKEADLLEFFLKHPGEVVSISRLYKEVWALEYGDSSVVKIYVLRLRRRLAEAGSTEDYIQTSFGMGYRFAKEVRTR